MGTQAQHEEGARTPAPRSVRSPAASRGMATNAGGSALDGIAQRANAGPHAASLAALGSVVAQRECAGCGAVKRTRAEPVQRAAADRTGLPAGLRAGLESLSGRDLSGVRVHYGSARPAQLNAHAYAQGTDIHLAAGQERHLPHEGWHVIQQMQNRVRPTLDVGGTAVNDDAALEREADVMGARAARSGTVQREADGAAEPRAGAPAAGGVVQRAVGFEFQTGWRVAPDAMGPVEGGISSAVGTLAGMLGVDEQSAQELGSGVGRLARGTVNLGSRALRGLGGLGLWGMRAVGAGGPADAIERGGEAVRKNAPLVIPKGWALVEGLGWTMSNDTGEMEFATTHVPEDDLGSMQAIMADMQRFTLKLAQLDGAGVVPLVWFGESTTLGKLAAVIPHDAEMKAVPQMTAGIDMAQVERLIRKSGIPGSKARRKLTRDAGPVLQDVAGALPPELDDASPEYRGIVSMLALHAVQSSRLPAVLTEKDITPLMARTSLGFAFQQTPERQDARAPRQVVALKRRLLRDVLATAAGANLGNEDIVPIAVSEQMRLFPSKTGLAHPSDNTARTGPTVREWVEGVVDGQDLSASTGFLDRVTARSMGAWEFTEPVGPGGGGTGLIVEFRNLPREIPRTEWSAWALTWMRMIAAANAGVRF